MKTIDQVKDCQAISLGYNSFRDLVINPKQDMQMYHLRLCIEKSMEEYAQQAISQMQPEWVKLHTEITDRIKQLREADAAFCYDRWENKEITQMERNMARESSNSVTLARQELESILKLFPQPPKDITK